MNWTGGRLRRHSEIKAKSRKQTFGKSSASSKGHGPHQITLFNSLARFQNSEETRGKVNHSSTGNRTSQTLPHQASSNTDTQTTSRLSDRLERMKRQLLETTDWAAVGAARPVQVDFVSEEELERFGKRRRLTKDDHERLNTSTAAHPGAREEGPLEGDVSENLEIRIDGRRPGQQEQAVNENSNPSNVYSQSMLLNDELLDLSHRVGDQGPHQGRGSASLLSMHSNSPQPRHEAPTLPCLRSSDQELAIPMRRDGLGSMDWVSEERMLEEELQSNNESSSIVLRPVSPVRRRFTIDDQEIAYGHHGFIISSPVSERYVTMPLVPPYQSERVHEESFEYRMRPSSGSSSQPGSRLATHGQRGNRPRPSAPRQIYPTFSWHPQDSVSLPVQELRTPEPWEGEEEERQFPARIYGQTVVFEGSNVRSDGHAMEHSEPGDNDMDLDEDNTYSSFSSGPVRFPSDRV
ncbi:hypothetical protein BJX76DRAFT_358253 [Aspergillus varians]